MPHSNFYNVEIYILILYKKKQLLFPAINETI